MNSWTVGSALKSPAPVSPVVPVVPVAPAVPAGIAVPVPAVLAAPPVVVAEVPVVPAVAALPTDGRVVMTVAEVVVVTSPDPASVDTVLVAGVVVAVVPVVPAMPVVVTGVVPTAVVLTGVVETGVVLSAVLGTVVPVMPVVLAVPVIPVVPAVPVVLPAPAPGAVAVPVEGVSSEGTPITTQVVPSRDKTIPGGQRPSDTKRFTCTPVWASPAGERTASAEAAAVAAMEREMMGRMMALLERAFLSDPSPFTEFFPASTERSVGGNPRSRSGSIRLHPMQQDFTDRDDHGRSILGDARKMKHGLLTLPDRRILSYAEYGDAHGFPVIVCHGIPGSRFQRHPDDSIARSAGVRVIVPERPGYGASSAQQGGTVADWSHDLCALVEHLSLSTLALAGVSGGAPYALAGAHRLRQRVTRVAVVSGVAPDLMEHSISPWSRLTLRMALRSPRALGRVLALPASVAARTPGGYMRLWSWRARTADRHILARPDVARVIAEDVPTALAQGATGVARDLSCITADWNFAPNQIRAPVAIWHGEADRSVPPTCAARLAASLNSAHVIHVPDAGHLVVFDLWGAVLAWLTLKN